jgi:hypothetical protein
LTNHDARLNIFEDSRTFHEAGHVLYEVLLSAGPQRGGHADQNVILHGYGPTGNELHFHCPVLYARSDRYLSQFDTAYQAEVPMMEGFPVVAAHPVVALGLGRA